jgi:hypothetical protein
MIVTMFECHSISCMYALTERNHHPRAEAATMFMASPQHASQAVVQHGPNGQQG